MTDYNVHNLAQAGAVHLKVGGGISELLMKGHESGLMRHPPYISGMAVKKPSSLGPDLHPLNSRAEVCKWAALHRVPRGSARQVSGMCQHKAPRGEGAGS